jgi:hypothetical protein
MGLHENSKHEIITAGQMMMYNDSKTTYSSHGMQPDKPRVHQATSVTTTFTTSVTSTQVQQDQLLTSIHAA